MTAPTREEIRLAVLREWGRWHMERPDVDDKFPLSGRLSDLVFMDLACGSTSALWLPLDPDGEESARHSALLNEIVGPLLPTIETMLLEGVATFVERFAQEFPDASRRRFAAVE